MSDAISHNEAVIQRRLADMAAIAPNHAASWESTIAMVKAAGKWDADGIARTLAAVVATLMAVEDMQKPGGAAMESCLGCTARGAACIHQEYLAAVKEWAASSQEGDPWRLNDGGVS